LRERAKYPDSEEVKKKADADVLFKRCFLAEDQ
jgi:hypothetical protein